MYWGTFILGMLLGSGGVLFYQKSKDGELQLSKPLWVLGIVWLLIGLFVFAFVGTSLAEGEPRAAGMGLTIFGAVFALISVFLFRALKGKDNKILPDKSAEL